MNKTTDIVELAKSLIACPSITPHDAGCQDIISQYLIALGFTVENMPAGEVSNLWARRGNAQPLLIFCGHTDVVPPGDIEQWTSPPFTPTIRDGYLYGRGATDMKSNIAAMLIACKDFIQQHPHHTGSIAFLITSDEEVGSEDGTQSVIKKLIDRDEVLTWCIVGEASSDQQLGDTIRIGRRGSLSGKIIVHGKQGHIAYPHLADNPIHRCLAAFDELQSTSWDTGNDAFPPTSFQFSNIHAGTGANNVIPNQLEALFNFRYSTAITVNELKQRLIAILDQYRLQYSLEWTVSGMPFLTQEGELISATQKAILDITQQKTQLSTGGGTSDGRFIAPTGCQVVELGVCNASAHQMNEHVRIADLEKLAHIYSRVLELLLTT